MSIFTTATRYITTTSDPCALVDIIDQKISLRYGGLLLSIEVSYSYNDQGKYAWDGELILFTRDDEHTLNVLNCAANQIRGYVQEFTEDHVKFWLSKSRNHWDNQYSITCAYYYTHSARAFIDKAIKGP